MAKTPENAGKPWTDDDIATLKKLAEENTPTRVIALKMGRSEVSVRSKATELRVSLMPPNRSPYSRKK